MSFFQWLNGNLDKVNITLSVSTIVMPEIAKIIEKKTLKKSLKILILRSCAVQAQIFAQKMPNLKKEQTN